MTNANTIHKEKECGFTGDELEVKWNVFYVLIGQNLVI